jgi:hypothetical protein
MTDDWALLDAQRTQDGGHPAHDLALAVRPLAFDRGLWQSTGHARELSSPPGEIADDRSVCRSTEAGGIRSVSVGFKDLFRQWHPVTPVFRDKDPVGCVRTVSAPPHHLRCRLSGHGAVGCYSLARGLPVMPAILAFARIARHDGRSLGPKLLGGW